MFLLNSLVCQYACRKQANSLPANTIYKAEIFNRINDLNSRTWDTIVQEKNPFLSTSYLSVLEQTHQQSLACRYVLFYQNTQIIGAAYFQILQINGEQNLRLKTDAKQNDENIVNSIKRYFKNKQI